MSIEKRRQAAEQLRRAIQMFVRSLSDDEAIEISTVYPDYELNKAYKVDDIFKFEYNAVGDPQLYRVVQAHTSQIDWRPDITPALYKAIGIDPVGYPVWSQPTGAHDAYNKGDVVRYAVDGKLYVSLVDGNVWAPDVYGWEEYPV